MYVGTTIYGTTAEAEAVARRVRALHARMRARDPFTGEEFRVDSPDLLMLGARHRGRVVRDHGPAGGGGR